MSVSKRLRFEILRRDSHTCRYCGAQAPDVKLAVDHVVPVALGGEDVPENLVCACVSCNAGKSSVPSDATLVADVADDAAKWADALAHAASRMEGDAEPRRAYADAVMHEWAAWLFAGEPAPVPPDWRQTVMRFHDLGLPLGAITDAVEIAIGAHKVRLEHRFRYFAGVCWRKVDELQDAARDVLDDAPSDDECVACGTVLLSDEDAVCVACERRHVLIGGALDHVLAARGPRKLREVV